MNPSTKLSERSAMALSRLERNDPTLRHLFVGSFESEARFHNDSGSYWPTGSADLERLGDATESNTHLQHLTIRNSHELEDTAVNNGAFFERFSRNSPINSLYLMGSDLSRGIGREMLNGVVANNSNLKQIMLLDDCTLGNGGAGVLTLAVSRCKNLTGINLCDCNANDAIVEELVSGIRGLRRFHLLDLGGNNVGRAGCEAIATLLRDPNCNLKCLDLRKNRIDDECATILANSLEGNHKLKSLDLSDNDAITESGWVAFSQVLSQMSSVNETYLSNHTLEQLGDDLPTNLSSLLAFNHGYDKKQVAMQKILHYHTHLDMEPFHLGWELEMLPRAVNWFDRARGNAQNNEVNVDSKKLSAIYQFARALPMMFVPSANKVTGKRKRLVKLAYDKAAK